MDDKVGTSMSEVAANPHLTASGAASTRSMQAFAALPSCKRLSFKKRQVVFHHGDPARQLFCVEEGAVMIQQYLEDGRRQLVEIVLPGGICGVSCDATYPSTAETLLSTVLLACRRSDLERHPELGWEIEHEVEHQLCALQEHALALGRMTALEKVSSLLVRFARQIADPEARASGNLLRIHLPMTRGEIGDYLGLSLETVCRTLTELQRRNVIEIGAHHGDVIVHGLRQLRRLAGSRA